MTFWRLVYPDIPLCTLFIGTTLSCRIHPDENSLQLFCGDFLIIFSHARDMAKDLEIPQKWWMVCLFLTGVYRSRRNYIDFCDTLTFYLMPPFFWIFHSSSEIA